MASSDPSSPFERLPNELLSLIFEQLLEDMALYWEQINAQIDDPNRSLTLQFILTPIHLNRRIRALVWHFCPAVWRSTATLIRVHAPVSIKGYRALLQLCSERSRHTLQTVNLRYMCPYDAICFSQISECLEILKRSAPKLLKIKVPWSHYDHAEQRGCRCGICKSALQPEAHKRWTDNSRLARPSQRIDLETKVSNAVFEIIGQASQLRTLSCIIEEYPQLEVLRRVAANIAARPKVLQLSVCDWLAPIEEGRDLCRKLASRVEVLELATTPIAGRLDFPAGNEAVEEPKVLYRIILQSAASTLRHLELKLVPDHFDEAAFGNSSFNRLETLLIYMETIEAPEAVFGASGDGPRCNLPVLKDLRASANIIGLLQAPLVEHLDLTIDNAEDVASAIRHLQQWPKVSILVLHFDPHVRTLQPLRESADPILRYLIPSANGSQAVPCPALEGLAIYDTIPPWIYGFNPVDKLPKRWSWREVLQKSKDLKRDPKEVFQQPQFGNMLALLEKQRRFWSVPHPSAPEPRCKAFKEIRIVGLIPDDKAWTRLMEASPGPRLYISPNPPTTQAKKLWDKWYEKDMRSDIDDPSECITYQPAAPLITLPDGRKVRSAALFRSAQQNGTLPTPSLSNRSGRQ